MDILTLDCAGRVVLTHCSRDHKVQRSLTLATSSYTATLCPCIASTIFSYYFVTMLTLLHNCDTVCYIHESGIAKLPDI